MKKITLIQMSNWIVRYFYIHPVTGEERKAGYSTLSAPSLEAARLQDTETEWCGVAISRKEFQRR